MSSGLLKRRPNDGTGGRGVVNSKKKKKNSYKKRKLKK